MAWERDRLARLRAARLQDEGRGLVAKQKAFWLELMWCSTAQLALGEVCASWRLL